MEYEKYSNSTELDDRIAYLKDFIDGRDAFKEDYAEYKKLTAIKTNLPKVKNILELREQLKNQKQAIQNEIKERKSVAEVEKELVILEDEMKNLQEEHDKLEEKIKASKTPEEKAELQAKLKNNEKQRQENNVKFGDCHEKNAEIRKRIFIGEFENMTMEDLENKALQISSNISECNIACNRLMKGFSWKSVDVALHKYETEKLVAKGQEATKMKKNREAAKAENSKEQQQVEASETINTKNEEAEPTKTETSSENKTEKEETENALIVKEEKKSVFSKIKDLYNRAKNWILRRKEDKDEAKEPETLTKQDAFRQYLKDVAEKGISGIEQEKLDAEKADKEARRKAAIDKLKANRAGKDTGATITKLDKEISEQDDNER